jgi:hypothetical protein
MLWCFQIQILFAICSLNFKKLLVTVPDFILNLLSVGFGSTGQQSSTFESLASQNTMTFGNLAQNQSQGFGSSTQSIFGGSHTQQQASAPAFSTGSNAFG